MDDDTDMPFSGESATVTGEPSLSPFSGACSAHELSRPQPSDPGTLVDAGAEVTVVAQDARSPLGSTRFYGEPPPQLPSLPPYRRLVLSRPPTWEEVPHSIKLILMRELTTWYSYRTAVAALRLTNGDEHAFVALYNTELQKKISFDNRMRGYTPADAATLNMVLRVAVPSYETDVIAMQDFDLAWSFLEGIGLDARTFDIAHWTSHAGVDRFRIVPAERDPSVAGHQCQLTDAGLAQRPRPSRRMTAVYQQTSARHKSSGSDCQSFRQVCKLFSG